MKTVTIRELHARTGRWVRAVAKHGQILVTDRGRTVAKLVHQSGEPQIPYFARRKTTAAFGKLDASGRTGRGTDSTIALSEDREDRV